MKKRIFLFFLCFLFLFAWMGSGASRVSAAEQNRYGYTLLENDAQRIAYDALQKGIGQLTLPVEFTAPGITQEDIFYAANMVYLDYPEYFWYDGSSKISWVAAQGKVSFRPSDGYMVDGVTVTKANIGTYQSALEQAASEALAGLTGKSNYDKALALHDFVASHVSYEKAGIESFYVSGESRGEAHGWNLVFLDGKCYYTDVTWDDQGDKLYHAYFMRSKEEINADHTPNNPNWLPDCNHRDSGYFTVKSGQGICVFRGSTTAAQIAAQCVTSEYGVYTCTVWDSAGTFLDWIQVQENWSNICRAMNLSGSLGLSYDYMAQEYQIRLTGTPSATTIPTQTEAAPPKPTETTVPVTAAPQTETTVSAAETTVWTAPAEAGETAASESVDTVPGGTQAVPVASDIPTNPTVQTDTPTEAVGAENQDAAPGTQVFAMVLGIGIFLAVAACLVHVIGRKGKRH